MPLFGIGFNREISAPSQVRLKMSFHDLMRVILVMVLRRGISLASEAYLLQEE